MNFIYKIPYRRAPRLAYALFSGRVRRASTGILHTRMNCEQSYWEFCSEDFSSNLFLVKEFF